MEKAYRFLDKSTKFLFIVGDEILKDTKYKKYQGTFELWEQFPKFRREMIDEVYSMKLLELDLMTFWGYWGARIEKIRKAKPSYSYELLGRIMKKFHPKDYFFITQNDLGFL